MRMSRREFLIATSATAAIAQVRADAAPLRAAVIGHSGRGDYGHGLAEIFSGRSGIELVGLADPVEEGRLRMAKSIGAPRSYQDWRELLDKERPELVSISMRHADQHAEIALGCLRAGAHVYVEKPFVLSPDEADAVLAEADGRGLRVAVAHTMRMSPAVRQLREALNRGVIGELREMQAFGKQDARAGGEDLMVLGTHLFDLMRLFAGDSLWVSARVQTQDREIMASDRRRVKDEVGWVAGDRVNAQLAFPAGVQGWFTSDSRLREITGHWGIEFRGSTGVAKLNCDLAPSVYVRKSSDWSAAGRREEWRPLDGVPEMSAANHNRAPVTDWLEAIAEHREPECSGRHGRWTIEMVMGIYQSALLGGRVEFPLKRRSHPLAP